MVEDAVVLAYEFHMLLHDFIYTHNWLLNLFKPIPFQCHLFSMSCWFQHAGLPTLLWSSKSSLSYFPELIEIIKVGRN